MIKKVCFKCNIEKELTEFYKHPQMGDGHLNKCKECTKRDVKQNYSGKREYYHAYEKKRLKDPIRRANKRRYMKDHNKRNPDKYQARMYLKNAVRDGRVFRQPCVFCGSLKAEAHHHDYSKPLDVVWACFKCHREREHNQVVTADHDNVLDENAAKPKQGKLPF